jgi:NAD(P)-dependent dehydrogenase (short-subunit alcohol dehydrogenase family)
VEVSVPASLESKIALVTGAAGGLGQAFARRLAQDGAHVVLVDIKPCEDTAAMVEAAGREAMSVICDITVEESVSYLASEVDMRFGRCDIVVNNAGIYPIQPFDQVTFADWRRVMALNLDAVFLVTKAFAPGMKRRGWGRIINVSSSTFNMVASGYTHYIASKGGVVGFTRALATEMGNFGVTVNAISPSLTRTPGTEGRAPRPGRVSMDEEFEQIARLQPIRRVQVPEDLVGVVSFLASDESAFMTGQTLYVDGGMVRV